MVQRVRDTETQQQQDNNNSTLMVTQGELSTWRRAGAIMLTLMGGVIGLYYMAIGVGYALRWAIMYG